MITTDVPTAVRDRMVLGLDVGGLAEAEAMAQRVAPWFGVVKVGHELYAEAGPAAFDRMHELGFKVFCDLKLHDIPNTVAKAVESAAKLGAQMLTIHLCGGSEMIRAAVSAKPRELSLLGVTVLTSADEQTLRQIGIPDKIEDHVLRLAKLGVEAGIGGLVAGPHELKMLRQQFGTKIELVVPGIRPSWSEAGDQKRVMTPHEALDAGADYLVIGRPIIADPRPSEAVNKILSELEG